MKLILIVSMLLSTMFAKHSDPVRCTGKNYVGYIFDSSYVVFMTIDKQEGRFTPSCEDIRKTEKILSENITDTNQQRLYQVDDCPIIHKNLPKYIRQYVGFINTKGQKIIWMNCLWNKSLENQAGKDIIHVDDGCSFFWNVEVNLDTKTLSNLMVNGPA